MQIPLLPHNRGMDKLPPRRHIQRAGLVHMLCRPAAILCQFRFRAADYRHQLVPIHARVVPQIALQFGNDRRRAGNRRRLAADPQRVIARRQMNIQQLPQQLQIAIGMAKEGRRIDARINGEIQIHEVLQLRGIDNTKAQRHVRPHEDSHVLFGDTDNSQSLMGAGGRVDVGFDRIRRADGMGKPMESVMVFVDPAGTEVNPAIRQRAISPDSPLGGKKQG